MQSRGAQSPWWNENEGAKWIPRSSYSTAPLPHSHLHLSAYSQASALPSLAPALCVSLPSEVPRAPKETVSLQRESDREKMPFLWLYQKTSRGHESLSHSQERGSLSLGQFRISYHWRDASNSLGLSALPSRLDKTMPHSRLAARFEFGSEREEREDADISPLHRVLYSKRSFTENSFSRIFNIFYTKKILN